MKRRPKIGTVIMNGDQGYRVVRLVEHVRADGTASRLLVLETPCAACGEPFQIVKSATAADMTRFNRRCPLHRRPGKPTRTSRGERFT